MEKTNYSNELYHHGKKGMKWGVRRYQNPDGSLTDAGKKRYARDAREREYDKYDKETNTYFKASKKNGRSDLSVDADRYVREDLSRSRKLAEETTGLTNKLKNTNDNSLRNKPKKTMDLSNMTEKEMRDKINRAILERQYNDMFAPKTTSKGREYASKILETTGTVVGITGSTLSIALAIKELRG